MIKTYSLASPALALVVFGACTITEVRSPPASPSGAHRTAPPIGTQINASPQRGGDASSTPTASSHKADAKTVAFTARVKVAVNACSGVPDGMAECSGVDSLNVCQGNEEFAVDCHTLAKAEGWDEGSCWETSVTTDCFGCDRKPDGSDVCCDLDMDDLCCDSAGRCWKP